MYRKLTFALRVGCSLADWRDERWPSPPMGWCFNDGHVQYMRVRDQRRLHLSAPPSLNAVDATGSKHPADMSASLKVGQKSIYVKEE